MTLHEVLHAHIPTLTPASSLRDAVDKMDIYQFPALTIVGEDMEVLAVITEGDICRAASQHGSLLKMSGEAAIHFATPNPTTAHPDTEVSDAFHQMLSTGITLLPVVDGGRFIGMVLRMDLMQAMLMDH